MQNKVPNQWLQELTPGCSALEMATAMNKDSRPATILCRSNLPRRSQLEREKKATCAEFEPPRSFKGHSLSGCLTRFPGRSSKPMVALSLVNWRYLLEYAGCLGTWATTYNLLAIYPITRLASSFASKANA